MHETTSKCKTLTPYSVTDGRFSEVIIWVKRLEVSIAEQLVTIASPNEHIFLREDFGGP